VANLNSHGDIPTTNRNLDSDTHTNDYRQLHPRSHGYPDPLADTLADNDPHSDPPPGNTESNIIPHCDANKKDLPDGYTANTLPDPQTAGHASNPITDHHPLANADSHHTHTDGYHLSNPVPLTQKGYLKPLQVVNNPGGVWFHHLYEFPR
jgi:hypothetical protein